MKLSAADKINTAFLVALALLFLIGIASVTSILRFTGISEEVSRTHVVLTQVQSVLGDMREAESAQRGYVITGDSAYIEPYRTARARIVGQIQALREHTYTDIGQQTRLSDLGDHVARRLAVMEEVVVARGLGLDTATALVATGRGRAIMDTIDAVADEVRLVESRRLQERTNGARASATLALIVIIGGSIFAFVVVFGSGAAIRRDLTERRRAESALRESETLLSQFMENLPIGVIVIDRDWKPRFANNAAVDILGPSILVDTGEPPLPLRRAADGESYESRTGPLATALSGETNTVDDCMVESPAGLVPVQVSAAPIYDASGRIAYAIAALEDISERRRTEAALRTAAEAAEAANRTKSDFLARMSHELRTPLNSVIGFANILLKNRKGNLTNQDSAYLTRILENGKHLLLLINDILDLSKIEAGKIEIERDATDLGELVTSVMGQFEGAPRAADVRLRTDLPNSLDPIITDPARLRQVLINLIGNAIKFTEAGSVTVRVETESGSGRAARIVVADTGIGIPEDRLSAIFQAFEQAESTTSRKYGGTGLGLPISKALCELLGYRLAVKSRVGEGTTFTVEMSPAESAEDTSPEGEAADAQHARASDRERLVLIVDDEPDSRILLTHYVEEFGCRAVTTYSAASALTLARELKPDLITLDLMMPEMTGWDLLSGLKQDPELAHIPVVIVSILAHESRATLLGAIDLLQKPVDRDALFRVLHRNLGSRKARVLIVDDEADSRELLEQMLEDRAAEIRVAMNGQEALTVLRDYDAELVITDLLMPVMDGMTFLEVFRATPRFQHVPVIVVSAKDLSGEERDRLDRHTSAVLKKGNALETDLRQVLGAILHEPAAG